MIETNQLIIIVLGLLAAVALIVMERMNASRSAEIEALLSGVAIQADRILANYGRQLEPVHHLALTAESLIDEDTDFAVQHLPAEVIQAAQTVVDFTKRFTDGVAGSEPEPEVADVSPVAGASRD